MIYVTRFNQEVFLINSDLIETIEETPDTVVTLTTGRKFLIKETCDEVVEKVISYKRRIIEGSSFMK